MSWFGAIAQSQSLDPKADSEQHQPQSKMVWNNVAIGGGGYVTGIIFHPKAKNVIYVHTNVGGAYRWDQDERRWIQLLDWLTPAHAN